MPAHGDMSELYDSWCEEDKTRRRRKTLRRLSEREDGRDHALEELPGRVLNHYVSDEEIAEFLDCEVHLFLTVKGRANWLDEAERFREMGLEFPDDAP